MAHKLPEFKGYTVDLRLKQFRKVQPGKPMKVLKFEDEKGEKLMVDWMVTKLDAFVAEVEYYQSINQSLDGDICLTAARLHQFRRKALAGDLMLGPDDIRLLKRMGVDIEKTPEEISSKAL